MRALGGGGGGGCSPAGGGGVAGGGPVAAHVLGLELSLGHVAELRHTWTLASWRFCYSFNKLDV